MADRKYSYICTCTPLLSTTALFSNAIFFSVPHLPLSHPNDHQMGTAEQTEGGEKSMSVETLRSKNHLLFTVSPEDESRAIDWG